MIVCDPRFTRTAAHADHFVRFRPGADVALIWGVLWHIFENGWEDKEYIRQRVYGMDEIRQEVARWTPEEVERVTGTPPDVVRRAAEIMNENRPGTIVWCMGGELSTRSATTIRGAYCVLCSLHSAISASPAAAPTSSEDMTMSKEQPTLVFFLTRCQVTMGCPTAHGNTGHVSGILTTSGSRGQFDAEEVEGDNGKPTHPMNYRGIPVSRWIDGILEDKENIGQRDNVRAMIYMGHAVNSQSRGPEMKKAMEMLDLMVIVDPHPTHAAVMNDRTDGIYLLPAATQFETYGSVTASNRSIQWRDKIIDPVWESLPDHTILYKLSKKLGFIVSS